MQSFPFDHLFCITKEGRFVCIFTQFCINDEVRFCRSYLPIFKDILGHSIILTSDIMILPRCFKLQFTVTLKEITRRRILNANKRRNQSINQSRVLFVFFLYLTVLVLQRSDDRDKGQSTLTRRQIALRLFTIIYIHR